MPYFKTEKGAKGYVNNEEMMPRLEELGYVRLVGGELLLHILWTVLKEWGIPALAALAVHYYTNDFLAALTTYAVAHQILD